MIHEDGGVFEGAKLAETRLLIRYAAQNLTPRQRLAVAGLLMERTDSELGEETGVSRQAIWQARQDALTAMRKRLERVGVSSAEVIL